MVGASSALCCDLTSYLLLLKKQREKERKKITKNMEWKWSIISIVPKNEIVNQLAHQTHTEENVSESQVDIFYLFFFASVLLFFVIFHGLFFIFNNSVPLVFVMSPFWTATWFFEVKAPSATLKSTTTSSSFGPIIHTVISVIMLQRG